VVEEGTWPTLIERGDGGDRAFVDAMLRLHWGREGSDHHALTALRVALLAAAARVHEGLRLRIAGGELRGAALRALFDAQAVDARDHFVEEVLGIAYPPLDEAVPEPELVTYCPSGYDEIVHAFEVTRLAPGERFLDIGSGAGKSVLLATLLHGAVGFGIERDADVFELSRVAATELAADACFTHDDARTAPLVPADVVFMYVPFTGTTLASVMTRLLAAPPRFLCASPLDLARYPSLEAVGEPRSWLQVYARR